MKPTPEERQRQMEEHTAQVLATPKVKREDKTALSYWFPLIQAAGVPVPKTTISLMPPEAQKSIWEGFDGKEPAPDEKIAFHAFVDHLKLMVAQVGGYPCFLRTDHTSNKHSWEDTCFLTCAADIPRHLFALAEFSEICDMMGLPWDTWVVREYLPIIPFGYCPDYGRMPICREFRFFVDDGVIRCRHPYWPRHALEQGGNALYDHEYDDLCRAPGDGAPFAYLAEAAGKAVGGSWSVDILETKRGYFVTDMAEAHKSFHWEGCPHA